MLEGILIIAIIAADQIVKHLTDLYLMPLGTSVPVVKGVFHFTSAHNQGAAFGLMQGWRWFFIVMTIVVCAALVFYLIRGRKVLSRFSRVVLSLLLAGALGNLIDRILLGYVRDMFDFCLINFAVFNVADSALTIGCALLVCNALFSRKGSVFDALPQNKKNDG